MTHARPIATIRQGVSAWTHRLTAVGISHLAVLVFVAGCQPTTPPKAAIPATQPGKSKSPPSAGIGKTKVPAIKDETPTDDSADKTALVPEGTKKPRVKFAGPSKTPKPVVRVLEASPLPLFLPTVEMTDGHRSTCVVDVGDALPQLSAENLDGEPQKLSELFGEKLTIIIFWNHRRVFALEQFVRLQADVEKLYEGTGVQVVAINVGDTRDDVAATYQASGAKFPCLIDPQGAAFAQVARHKMPRTYVVDPAGKILWFDIEYSRSTARELDNAVRFFLQPPGEQKTL